MKKARDRNVEQLHHRGGKGPHRVKGKDQRVGRKRLKEALRRLLRQVDEE